LSRTKSLAQRTVASISWNFVANLVQTGVSFVRSVLLARLLPVETFGVYAWASSVVTLSAVIPDFGFVDAFVHRAPETEDEEQAAAVHFTLQLVFTLTWAAVLIGGALIWASGQTRLALVLLAATAAGVQLTRTPRLILARRVVHRRLALVNLVDALVSAIVAVGLAWRGVTLWSLLATNLITLVVSVVLLYVWRPVWRPRLLWRPPVMRYFLQFGSKSVLATALSRALDRVDDLWVGAYLGEVSMGFYSKAYSFATYPRKILAAPVYKVAGGTYAELKGDRKRLSQAFFRVNAFLLRSGFFLAGLLSLVAPEFIRLLLSAKWLPMLGIFRLMLVYTLFDPIKLTVANLFVAVGKPEQVVWAGAVQLAVLVAGLFAFGPFLGTVGVALAVDLMLVVGIAILLWQARSYVDFAVWRLLAVPGLALAVGMLLASGASTLSGVAGIDWRTGLAKILVFSVAYGLCLFALEHRQVMEALSALSKLMSRETGR